MNVPSGYSALDLVGYTDRGTYSGSANYVQNDIVGYNGNKWKCKLDDTTGIPPTEGVNWELWITGQDSIEDMDDVEFTALANGDVIEYDAIEEKWKNSNAVKSLKETFTNQVNVNGVKNLCPNNKVGTTVVQGGLTWTFNSDGTVSVTGTNTQDYNTFYIGTTEPLKNGETYVISGSKNVPSGSCYIRVSRDGTTIADNWKGTPISFVADGGKYAVSLYVRTVGITYDFTFEPMICLKKLYDFDPTYVPYAKTNKELTEIVGPLKTQFDADHNIVKTVRETMNIFLTDNAMPSDWSNLTTQQATDIAQALYDVFKKIGGASGIRYSGIVTLFYKKISDGSKLSSSIDMVDIYSNVSYEQMLTDNANARFTMVRHPYGSTQQVIFALWGKSLMYSNHGINNIGTVADNDKKYTYNTISTYKG